MAAWAADSRFAKAGFLCVCVDPSALSTAQEFRQLYFRRAPESLVNGYIDSRGDFPNFNAQLGCQGFVIFDSKHQIVAGATPAWVQHREGAFRNVEGWLSKLLGSAAPENPMAAPVGQLVRIHGLTSESGAKLNGQCGEVVGSNDAGRYLVTVGGERKALLPGNLEDATDAPVGKRFRIQGISAEQWRRLNGQEGQVVGGTANGRIIVKLSAEDRTVSLRRDNLQEVSGGALDPKDAFAAVASVGHDAMDAQHSDCIAALKELSGSLTVKALQEVRRVLKEHFDDEERLLTQAGFGGGNGTAEPGAFSALGSHSKDHVRIIGIADDALASLTNVCSTSDSYGGTVPKAVAADLCKAFVDHAAMYDSLYEGKLHAAPEASELQQMDSVD